MQQSELLFQIVSELYKHREGDYYCNLVFLFNELEIDWTGPEYEQIFTELYEKNYVIPYKDSKEDFKISPEGIAYLQTEKSKRGQMTQKEKLDTILKHIYKHKDDGCWYDVKLVMQILKIYENDIEVERSVNKLIEDGLVYPKDKGVTYRFSSYSLVKISSTGIDYCEESSYTKPGTSLISNNYYYVSGTGNNFISNSSRFTVKQQIGEESKILELIEQLKKQVDEEQILDSLREDIKECADQIASKVSSKQRVSSFAIKELTSYGADVASIGGFVTQILQALNPLS